MSTRTEPIHEAFHASASLPSRARRVIRSIVSTFFPRHACPECPRLLYVQLDSVDQSFVHCPDHGSALVGAGIDC